MKGPQRPPNPPPEWVFSRWFAALAVLVPLGVAFTPVAPLALIAWPVLGVQAYEDHRVNGLNQAWPSVVVTLGPVVYPFYVRDHRRLLSRLANAKPPAQRADGSVLESARAAPADWYPDPLGRVRVRYWDGSAWTSFAAR